MGSIFIYKRLKWLYIAILTYMLPYFRHFNDGLPILKKVAHEPACFFLNIINILVNPSYDQFLEKRHYQKVLFVPTKNMTKMYASSYNVLYICVHISSYNNIVHVVVSHGYCTYIIKYIIIYILIVTIAFIITRHIHVDDEQGGCPIASVYGYLTCMVYLPQPSACCQGITYICI